MPVDSSAHISDETSYHPAHQDLDGSVNRSTMRSLSPERLENARKLRNQLFFVHVLLATLASVLGDALSFAYFLQFGHFALSLVVPLSLDPTGMYKTAVPLSNVAAFAGTFAIGIPRLVVTMVSTGWNLEECATNNSLETAVRWREQGIWQAVPAPMMLVALYAWDTMAGPFAVLIDKSWPTKEVTLDVWHAAGAALLGRVVMETTWKVLCMCVKWRLDSVRAQKLEKERELEKAEDGSAAGVRKDLS